MEEKQTNFTFEIDNFFDKEAVISSPTFSSGGCEWFVKVFPKGDLVDDHMSLYLCVANPESLRRGWKRRAIYSLVLLNQSCKDLFRKDVEVVDEGDPTENEKFVYYGFQILYSQVISVARLFVKHPDVAVNFRLSNQLVKTTYMNILLGLIETLNKPPLSISKTALSNARSELIELTEAGFKLDWMKIQSLSKCPWRGGKKMVMCLESKNSRNRSRIASLN
ncbi:unnamed protein product [Microthlaspi erraticum]|uniref:MATH domain-containing protein n=1 Tax=Microthlaspi erraticum TaxID=1685480 RepID=A0A6D2HEK8_9BRAS|nr:unnamed protein product [Microthlaspi erraticum]CAA7047349.1 unnamed protein product [Microthlaspi erraticum]